MMWWSGGDHMGGGGWIGMGFMILFWIAAVVGVVYLVRYLVARPGADQWRERSPEWRGPDSAGPEPGRSNAVRTLEDRYARGEVNRDEFLQRRDDLLGKSG